MSEHDPQEPFFSDEPELEALDPDEILYPEPFHDPNDFAPIPSPRAGLRDLLALSWHILFVLVITLVVPLALVWVVYRLYRWLPFETMALVIAGLAAAWAYRDKLGDLLRTLVVGKDRKTG